MILRLLGLVYTVAFLIVIDQGPGLVGESGILPASDYIARFMSSYDSSASAFIAKPSVFIFSYSDGLFLGLAWLGLILSVLLLVGFDNLLILGGLWFLYLSFVHVGQIWYGYGWESQLLETGFLAIFLTSMLPQALLGSGTARPGHLALPVVSLSDHVRLGTDQTSNGPLLVEPDLS